MYRCGGAQRRLLGDKANAPMGCRKMAFDPEETGVWERASPSQVFKLCKVQSRVRFSRSPIASGSSLTPPSPARA